MARSRNEIETAEKEIFMRKTNKKRIPKFKSEDEEREFWATHSPLDFFDKSIFKRVTFPNLKPSVKTISIRLPEMMIEQLKLLANMRNVPYKSLLKMFLGDRIEKELSYSTKL
jgi:predicted DNA binding CopG/RHH family protein